MELYTNNIFWSMYEISHLCQSIAKIEVSLLQKFINTNATKLHRTIIRAETTSKKTPSYMHESLCRLLIVENAKIF